MGTGKNILVAIAIVFTGLSAFSAERRTRHTVTGKSKDVNAFYHEIIECRIAVKDAYQKAYEYCYERGYDTYTRERLNNCRPRLFGGMNVKMSFYCE